MKFEYFKYPEKFTFILNKPTPCSVCREVGLWFDAAGYSGVKDIECICTNCLQSGKLIDMNIEANLSFDDGSEASKIIIYKTPSLPTWQDTFWPVIEGSFPVFECIASKQDFLDKNEFLNSFIENDQKKEEIEWLWDRLPPKKLNHYNESGDISVYLFSLKDKKYWIWDAN
jgi:uncharacterized protein CbrC (UPF0167 family)